ncbi:MAG: formate dehydrogenase subunit gamma [Pseudomonas sp.]|jgi:formate dehydrogenase subunit gamma|uniref:formate dehydrogenase subunit gamma n=1 Tax=Pseudomonas sp. TaxID=306 RepID=UPI00299EA0E7|nr:formate dehydrogenase subunit gamma [Pseudomonas sp.]MDX1722297.1 formate dehydrogenase subunit gamma [Pseudomonas sp.]
MATLPQRFDPEQYQAVTREVLAAHRDEPGALLPILHDIQDRLGAVPPEVLPLIAEDLCLSRAEVHGVVSFYHDFRASPPGRVHLKLCQAEACQSMGSKALTDELQEKLGLQLGETRADGSLTLEAVYCLGNCACAPNAMLNGQLHGRVDVEDLLDLVEEQEARA